MTLPERSPLATTSPIQYVDSQPTFDAILRGLRAEPLLGVDTEAASFHRYLDRIYLIQISSREMTAVIDPLAVPDLGLLRDALADPSVEIVFHDADYDLRILDRDYGFHATNLFDTRLAAQLLNEPAIGLAALLEKHVGVRLDKRFQRADWSMRPLRPGMLEYAAADTNYLPALRDLMQRRLDESGRWSWALEEFRILEDVRWTPAGPSDAAFLRLKGAKALRGRALAVLRELYTWREEAARRLDRAPFRVMSNEALIAIAQAMPQDVATLGTLPGISLETASRRGAELLAAVNRGLQAPADSIPSFERPRRPPPDPEFDASLERLKSTRNSLASHFDLAPGVLCPNGTLEALARGRPGNLEDMSRVPGMRRWQVEAFGEELLKAVSGGPEPDSDAR